MSSAGWVHMELAIYARVSSEVQWLALVDEIRGLAAGAEGAEGI